MVGYAFIMGLVGVANPCGLPLLPAYLSFFVSGSGSVGVRAVRAVVASACVTAGFVTTFGIIGLALGGVLAGIESAMPPVMIVAGAVMALLGLVTILRGNLSLPSLRIRFAVPGRGPVAMVAFGVLYGAGSLGCSLPVFIAAMGGSLDHRGVWPVVRSCVAYALGMGTLLAVVAVAGAIAGGGVPRLIRASGRLGPRLAGVLLAASGTYLAYYWTVTWRDPNRVPALVAAVDRVQAHIAGWLTANADWLGLGSGVLVVGVLLAAAVGAPSISATPSVSTTRREHS